MVKKITGLVFILSVIFSLNTIAQCKIENKFFQAGETLEMDLYFKFGPLFKKAGTSSLTTVNHNYNGVDALKMTLMAESTGAARKVFALNDTLSCIMSKDLVPLAYVKNAFEGDDYTQERVTYSYSGSEVTVNTKRHRNGEFKYDETMKASSCIYDMMSVVYYARTLDFTNMTKGSTARIEFISGKKKVTMIIEYDGTERVKANDGNKYDCIKLVLSIMDDAFKDKKESMKVFITNDNNRMPVKLNTKLKVGSTEAVLKSYKGNKYPITTYK